MHSQRQEGESFEELMTPAYEPGYSVWRRLSEGTTIGKVCVSGCGVRRLPVMVPLAQEHTAGKYSPPHLRINILVITHTVTTRKTSSIGRNWAIAQ